MRQISKKFLVIHCMPMLCERILQLGALSTSCSWWYTLSFFLVMPINEIYYNDAIMSVIASQITKLTIAYSTVYSGADQRNHQSSVSLAFVRGIHRWPVNSPHKCPVTRKMFPFDNVIMFCRFRFQNFAEKRLANVWRKWNCSSFLNILSIRWHKIAHTCGGIKWQHL